MSWLIVAVVAYFLLAGSAVLDKVILTRPIRSSLLYATYIGLVAGYALIALPFFFSLADFGGRWDLVLRSLASGVLNILAMIAFYEAVKRSDVSRAAPLVGVFTAFFTFILGSALGVEALDAFEIIIFIVLVGGAMLLIRSHVELVAVLAAFLLSISIILIKSVYQNADFLSAFLTARSGDFLTGLALAVFFGKKLNLKENWQSLRGKTLGWLGFLKVVVGSGLLVQHYAIFLGSAILVQALSGLQYFFVWLIVAVVAAIWKSLPREKFPIGTIIVLLGLFLLAFSGRPVELTPGVKSWGVTFSKLFADQLGIDWRGAYGTLLDDLKVRKIRLPVYWSEVERSPGVYDFRDYDFLVERAGERGAKLVLVVGRRLPRWPECHIPRWAEKLGGTEQQEKVLEFVKTAVERYRRHGFIEAWQVENEPFLKEFGLCPEPDPEFLDRQIGLVKSLDSRPVIITDSGEIGSWLGSARRADIFGTTMFGVVWRDEFPSGYVRYPSMPSLYYFKTNFAKIFAGLKDVIVSELQAEPWGPGMIYELTPDEQQKSMNLKQFRKNIKLAEGVGFREAYLWGAEWWFKEKLEGRPEIWEEARRLFTETK